MDQTWSDDDEEVERRIQSHLCSIRIALQRDGFQSSDRKWVEGKLRDIVENVDGPVAKMLALNDRGEGR